MVFRKLLLAFVVVLCLNLSIVAFAHPGGTDSDGGHTNSGTGEYHYHHGYSAHQHYDMDGDGDWDCPYLFVDKTDSSYVDDFWAADEKYKAEPTEEPPTIPGLQHLTNSSKKESKTVWDYVSETICILLELYVVVGLGWGVIKIIKQISRR